MDFFKGIEKEQCQTSQGEVSSHNKKGTPREGGRRADEEKRTCQVQCQSSITLLKACKKFIGPFLGLLHTYF